MRNKIILAIFVLAVFVSLCFLGNKLYQSKRSMGSQVLKKVSLRLKWIDQAQFAGYYLAKTQGFYSKRGLDVEINPGGPDISSVQMVTTGADDFGITGADQIILARGKGIPIVALAVLYKKSPVVIVSLKESNIIFPKDLENKIIAVVYGRDEETIYRTLLQKAGVNVDKINEVSCMTNASQLVSKQVDAQVGYETNEVILLEEKGFEVNVIRPGDYGVNFYADTLFTTEEMVRENPDLVSGFVQATIEGWKMAIAKPNIAIDEVMNVNKSLNREHQSKFLEYSLPMIINKGEIGRSEEKSWEQMQEILISQGILKTSVNLEGVFTNDFLAK